MTKSALAFETSCVYSVILVINTMEEVLLLTSDVLDVAPLSRNCMVPFVCSLFVHSLRQSFYFFARTFIIKEIQTHSLTYICHEVRTVYTAS